MATAQYTPSPFPCSIVVVQTTGRRGKTFKFERKNWCVLGANKDCDIIVPFPGVAQLQALIHVKRNGVFLQGIDKHTAVRHPRLKKELLNEEEVMVLPGDIILLGNREFIIEYSAEDVCIETSNGIARTLSGESSSSRKTPRLRRRRKSSIMVGEFDETYVIPTNGSEKLLSDHQLARVSKNEAEIQPEQKGQPTSKDDESRLQHESSQSQSGEEEMCFRSLSSDNSEVFSSEEGSVSRTINFDSTNEGSRESKNCEAERISTSSSEQSKVVSVKKQRRKLIFDRLSKGLPATPRRRGKESTFDQREAHLQTTLKDTSCNGANIASGKENVPLHGTSKDPDVKKDKDTPSMKDLENAHSIRSPLANRVELENQASPPITRVRTPTSKGLLGSARARNTYAQTPRARSVAFAATIELAPGAHYSPFRPRKMTTKSGSATRVKRYVKEMPTKEIHSAPRSKRPTVPSSSTLQKVGHPLNQPSDISGPASITHQFHKAADAQGSRTDINRGEAKPVVEYEDDSNPPTPSSSEDENDASQLPSLSAPSPMSRVGGALAGFLKRLSGNFESDQEDDSSFETDSEQAHKRLSFSEDLNESKKHSIPSTYAPMSPEPVMSSLELQELSQTVSPEQRREFVNQVLSAANDVREVTNPVSNECLRGSLNSEEGISFSQTCKSPLQDKEANACPKKLPTKSAPPSPGSELLGVSTASESSDISVEEAREVTSGSDEENHDSTNESIGSEVHSSIGSDNNDGLGCSRSTSLEVTSSEGDVPELEMETEILHNVNVIGGLDETDDEDAVERDYGDDPWDDLDTGEGNESDEREVAAVVLEDDGDIQNISVFGQARVSEKKIEFDFEQAQLDELKEEEKDSPSQSDTRNLRSTSQHSTDVEQRVPSPDEDSNVSDGFSASVSDEISSSECDLSSASSTGTERLLEDDPRDAVQITSTPEKKTEDSMPSSAPPSDELEISKKELSRLKKDELKKRLGQRGLDVEGLKKDLVDRLAQAMTVPGTSSEGEENLNEAEPQYQEKGDEEMVDLTNVTEPSTGHGTSQRSEEKIRNTTPGRSRAATRRLTRRSLAGQQSTASPPQIPKTVQDAEFDAESKDLPDISQYRRRTMRELRQFLMNRGLDTQLKMRKDELIQHLISHSIGSDGQLLEESNVSDDEKKLTSNTSDTQAQEKPLPKSSQKMTVAQIRTLLREQGQCQAGTKKILLDRLTAHPERRTRSRRAMDDTSCALCKEGKPCEAAAKK